MPISEAQNAVKNMMKRFNKNHKEWNAFVILADLTEEMGEVAQALKILEGYKKERLDNNDAKGNFAMELADLLYSLLMLANEYNINLDDEFEKILKSYNSRFLSGA